MTSGGMWAEGDELFSIEDPFLFMQISLFIKKKKKKMKKKKALKSAI